MIRISIKKLTVFITVICLFSGFYYANNLVKHRGYNSLLSFLKISSINITKGESAELNLSIEIEPEHFKKIEQVRNAALKRGVIIQPEEPYVPCKLIYKGETIRGEIRLKGKMTDHVSGKKWSFRVKTNKNDAFLGMQRFTLQHPGTRGYVYEWLHHEMCKHEGIIALRYEFINLTLNGDDIGVYAVEENFGQPLVRNNKRPKGPVFRFNPTLYWQARLNAINRVYIAQEFTNFQNAHIESFSKKETFTDSNLKASFVEANNRLNKVRWGELSVAQVFDIEKLAMRYALLDLCGGYHSVDWSDIKFYYNPILNKIEPIAYESFGPRYIGKVIGNYRFHKPKNELPSDFHDIIFSDSTFFSEYVRALRKVSSNDYLSDIIAELKPELDKRIAIQYSEFPYKNFSTDVFESNIKTIRKSLDAPKNFHAFLQKRTDTSLVLQLQGIESLPSEILGIQIANEQFFLKNPSLLQSLKEDHKPIFKMMNFPLDSTVKIDTERARDLKVLYRVLGDTLIKICEVFPYHIEEYNSNSLFEKQVTIPTSELGFFVIDSASNSYLINSRNLEIDQLITIPKNWILKATSPLNLSFTENGGLIIQGSMDLRGQENDPITIRINTGQKHWIQLKGKQQTSTLNSVVINNETTSSILCYGTSLSSSNVIFKGEYERAVESFNSSLNISSSLFLGSSQSAIKSSFSTLVIQNCKFIDCKKGLDSKAGRLNINGSLFNNTKVAIESKRKDKVTLTNIDVDNARIAFVVKDEASLNWNSGKISNSKLGFKVTRSGNLYGYAKVEVENIAIETVKEKFLLEEKNVLILNGEEVIPNKK